MNRIYTLILGFAALISSQFAKADEGMWIPALLTDNHAEMQRLGLTLSADQLYSVNNSSMKDAIVRLGRGFCTGEIISDQGLILTNHHCGYSAIQKLSTPTANLLKNGFWAKTKADEKSAGFSVSFLVKIVDITDEVLAGVTDANRAQTVAKNSSDIRTEYSNDGAYVVDIKEMFSGNKYFAYVYETFGDVRLVGTPPESVGKYGGDTDNWMWPRHTGDFSMFRVYADKDNKATKDYSEDNIPYTPKHHLPVSIKGVEQGDFAMIWGFPGSTDRYLSSYGVKLATDKDQPARVKIRRAKLDIYEKYQEQDEAVDLMYAAKHAQVANYWKYFIGQTKGLKRLKIYEKKQSEEKAFQDWVDAGDANRKEKFGSVIGLYQDAYKTYDEKTLAQTYWMEAIYGIEFTGYGFGFAGLKGLYQALGNAKDDSSKAMIQGQINQTVDGLLGSTDGHFKDYYKPIDKDVAKQMLNFYVNDIPEDQRPREFNSLLSKYKGNIDKFVEKLFTTSILVDKDKATAFLNNPSSKKLKKDLGVRFSEIMLSFYRKDLQAMFGEAGQKRATADRLYKAALFEMHPDKAFAPNANSSMRFTYGQVLNYSPGDAMLYKHFTTMRGVMEKYQPGDHEFDLPEEYLKVAKEKDYGQYAKEGEDLRVCFLSNNDITGGNSGSPVINGNGELIGLAFDGNWEAMSGDIAFEDELQRTISVDIRYVLWCIDKLAGAGHIVEEMTLVR
ncbi:MAG: S46 family peptidase [Bacteroidia bacterium]|nr:S46 family peptidase [Bacteroidia bacterium]NNJ55960.1 S46 family peptidase [Bacteroidia bacterium]